MSSPSTEAESRCVFCGSEALQRRYVTRSFGQGADLLLVERIPMWWCSHCGESFFTARTMHAIDRIKALRRSLAQPRSVSVAKFEEVATA